jgi:DNA-binding XRE family transcriptional regulator
LTRRKNSDNFNCMGKNIPDDDNLTSGQYIRKLRDAAGFSQTEAAVAAEYNLRSWQHIECDTVEPKVRIAIRMARILDVTVEDIWG